MIGIGLSSSPIVKLDVLESLSSKIAAARFSGVNGPTKGYLGAQGTLDFDGMIDLDIPGMEIGVLGVSTGQSNTDNYGVLGHSNHWGGKLELPPLA